MSCNEKLQRWHKKGSSRNKRAATQIKLIYMRNLRGARRDIKKVRAKKKVLSGSDSDYSDWYRRDVLEMEGKVKTKIKTMKPVESHFFSVLSQHKKKKSGLYLHLRYQTEFENREAGLEYNEHILKPRFEENTESVWRPKKAESKSHSFLTDIG